MENSNNHREEISQFVEKMVEKHGFLPKFAHNMVAKNPEKVYYGGPYFDNNELVAAIETLLFGKWSSSGEVCARFEREFSKYIGQKESFFCNSGSSANLLLIAACKEYFGWKDGDKILVSAVGFPTTVSAIVQNGLVPVFVDIEWETLNFNLDRVAKELEYYEASPFVAPVAIFISPVLGNPPDFDKLVEISNKFKIKLLLDGCDSLGSRWDGKYLSDYAVATSCSFYPAHEMTTLEGGMVSSNISEIVELARSFGTWGRDCYCVGAANLSCNGSCGKRFSNWIPDFPELIIDHKYVFNRIGYNLKPLDLQAAIGLEQLKKLDYICETRAENKRKITNLFLFYVKGVLFPQSHVKTDWVPFGVPIICESKELKHKLVAYLEANGVQTRNYFAGNLLMHKGYKHLGNYLDYPESNKVLDLVFFVGCAPTISLDNIEHIHKVLSLWKN
jgi:CDP-6-deoxy-D-xylo-4-hexulose-3-dehydrase